MGWDRAADVGARLKDLRDALGLKQEEFSELVGVTGQSVSDYETGRSQPSKSRLVRLAGRVGIPVVAFAEGGPMPSTVLKRPLAAHSGNHVGQKVAAFPSGSYDTLSVEEVRRRFNARLDEVQGNMPLAEAVWWVGLALRARRSGDSE